MRIGRYGLVRLLGAGGQGRVYEAVLADPVAGARAVAVKVVDDQRTLRREARLGSLLRHVHLVDVYEAGEEDGAAWLAMELCPDGALRERIPLPPRAVVEVGIAVADALAYAWDELGLVHLDLKPGNLLLAGAVVKVADLGIARTADGGGDLIVGTRGYVAPEVRRGARPDPRADIWSLAVVLQELAGAPGAGSRGSDTFALDLDEEGPAPAPAALPEALNGVVARCLATDPADRYPSMAALGDALRAVVVDGPGLAAHLGLPAAAPGPDDDLVPFVGRAAALEGIRGELRTPGIVTLRGPGGIGKSRLAREAVAAIPVDLSAVRSQDELAAALAAALGLQAGRREGEALLDAVADALRARGDAVLLLDEAEHLGPDAAVVGRLAAAAPELRVLATSRHALGADGERVIEVDALPHDEAVALLVAAAARRWVALSADDPAVVALARRVEGVPLALELAAGRLGVLGPAEVLERLSVSFLRSPRAGTADRAATLEGALAWSWDHLEPAEQQALVELSVFRGAFTLASARAVVARPDVPEILRVLLDRSLVHRSGNRFAMLEIVREHVARRGDPGPAEARHGRLFASRAALPPEDYDRRDGAARAALQAELDDLVAAVERAVARGDGPVAVGAALAAWRVYASRGPFAAGLALLEAARGVAGGHRRGELGLGLSKACYQLGRTDDARRELEALIAAGDRSAVVRAQLGEIERVARRFDVAEAHLRAALDGHRAAGQRRSEGMTLSNLAGTLHDAGRSGEAGAVYEEALAVHRELGNRRSEAIALLNLGLVRMSTGRLEEGEDLLRAGIAAFVELGDRRGRAVAEANLAVVLRHAARVDEAATMLARVRAELEALGDRWYLGLVSSNLGEMWLEQGRAAAPLLEAALAIHREVGNRRWVGFTALLLSEVARVRGDGGGALAWADAAAEPLAADASRVPDIALRQRGRVLRDLGRLDAAQDTLEQAARAADAGEAALAAIELAALHLARGARAQARAAIDAARARPVPAYERRLRGLVALADAEVRHAEGDDAGARAALAEVEDLLAGAGRGERWAMLLCLRASMLGDADALADARAIAAGLGAGPDSPLGRRISRQG